MSATPPPDLTRLRIDRGMAPVRRRRRRWLWLGIIVVLALAAGVLFLLGPKVARVETTPVVTTWPSQQFVVLNATGYVVAQRKAAIASKATGRLEWLGVAEGSRVKEGEVIARLDDRDVQAQAQSAQASVGAARAGLEQARVEQQNAAVELRRNQDLVGQGFISRSALDTA
jgi:multidrug efflux pump subunit AcrA (membrane-fusion protein)